MTSGFSRRRFLVLMMGLSGAAILGPGPAGADARDDFLHLCAELTGLPSSSLDPELAALYLDLLRRWGEPVEAMLSWPEGPAAATIEPRFERLSETILELWYTGSYETPQGHRVATYRHCLAWRAVDFAQPPSYCGAPWWESP